MASNLGLNVYVAVCASFFAKLPELTLHKEITKFMARTGIHESGQGAGRDVSVKRETVA